MHRRLVGRNRALERIDFRLLLVAQLDRLDALAGHLDVAVEVQFGADQLRLVARLGRGGFVERGLEGPRIDLEQRVAGLDVLAFLEGDLDDLAVDARLDDGHVVGLHRADAAHVDRHVLLLGDRRGHGNGGLSGDRRPGRPVAAGMLQEEVAGAGYAERGRRWRPAWQRSSFFIRSNSIGGKQRVRRYAPRDQCSRFSGRTGGIKSVTATVSVCICPHSAAAVRGGSPPAQAARQPVEVEIDDGRGEQSKPLRHQEAAHDRDAGGRRSSSTAQSQRQAADDGGDGRHHDRPKRHQAAS